MTLREAALVGVVPDQESPVPPYNPLPPWALPGAAAGTGSLSCRLDGEVLRGLQARARSGGPRVQDLLAAGWAWVLATCLGEPRVVTAVRTPDSELSRLDVVVRGETAAGIARQVVGTSTTELDGTAPRTLLDLSALDAPAAGASAVAGPAVVVRLDRRGSEVELCIEYAREHVGRPAAERLLGYLERAWRHLGADPGVPLEDVPLLSPEEVEHQVRDLAGPCRDNGPDLFVEAFRAQVLRRSDAVAASHAESCLTYRQLDVLSDGVAGALQAQGLEPGECVAVVSDRHLDWIAMLIGVLKAGGAYLPVRTDFPAARVLEQVTRSRCRFAVVDEPGARLADQVAALSGRPLVRLGVADAVLPARPVAPDPNGLAYVYFTSGSTGRPKGAMCEHAGMLNHLWTKVDDHALTEDDVVFQTASQCFDISLWQVCAPLLVGGETRVVDTAVQLDVERFLAEVDGAGATVVQVVPSYLEVLLASLEDKPRDLSLRSLSVTGEALRSDLVRRWFAAQPGTALVNAYGATEVSDDTMHEVLTGPPARDLAVVPVGRALRNVRVYITDDAQRLVPLGARGEIVFAGVAVGRGYINDEARTAEAFLPDPYVPGDRLYRTGDFGRWLPEGRIEFLGRRDEQVKMRGLRIEIGEVESALLRAPQVHDVAVVVRGVGQAAQLVAFYSAAALIEPADLHDLLSASLPQYMVPAFFHQLDSIPLNDNGKTDKFALRTLADELCEAGTAFDPPRTPTERRLATAWAAVLDVPGGRVGRADSFFQLGGTSLAAVHLLVRLDRALSLRDLVAHPVLKDQAAIIDAAAPAGSSEGDRPAMSPGPPRTADRILQRLSAAVVERAQELPLVVCFPGAGGNGLNFYQLSRQLQRRDIEVLAAELPGHDVTRPEEPLQPLARIAAGIVDELSRADRGQVLLWGHGSGTALAIEVARLLTEAGSGPSHVFLAGSMLGTVESIADELADLRSRTQSQVLDDLRRLHGFVDLGEMRDERAAVAARAYRHDVQEAADLFLQVLRDPQPYALSCPVTVVAAADDPATSPALVRAARWHDIAPLARTHVLDDGGPEFVRTRSAASASVVASAVSALAGRP
jgi:amino acid adenylation domain-containing protein